MPLRQTLETAIHQAVAEGEYANRQEALDDLVALVGSDDGSSDGEDHSTAYAQETASAGPLLDALFRSTVCFAIIITDLPGNVVAWNEGAVRIIGWTFQEMDGQSADIFFTEEDRQRGAPHEEKLVALERGSAPDERWHVRKDGSRFWGSGFMMPLLDSRAKAIGFIKVVQERSPPG
jgi:PAS domain S-box-containing protein